ICGNDPHASLIENILVALRLHEELLHEAVEGLGPPLNGTPQSSGTARRLRPLLDLVDELLVLRALSLESSEVLLDGHYRAPRTPFSRDSTASFVFPPAISSILTVLL